MVELGRSAVHGNHYIFARFVSGSLDKRGSVEESGGILKASWHIGLCGPIRYSKENGRVIIGARQDGNIIELYVQDFGKGIDPRYHQSIFDRYFRVPGTKVQGSGLGLSISKDFVEAHGGTLTVESELGKGSRFVMRLKA